MGPVHQHKVSCRARVKWFRMDKGFGFVILLDGPFEGSEALLLMSTCPQFGHALDSDSVLSVTVVADKKGLRVDRMNPAS